MNTRNEPLWSSVQPEPWPDRVFIEREYLKLMADLLNADPVPAVEVVTIAGDQSNSDASFAFELHPSVCCWVEPATEIDAEHFGLPSPKGNLVLSLRHIGCPFNYSTCVVFKSETDIDGLEAVRAVKAALERSETQRRFGMLAASAAARCEAILQAAQGDRLLAAHFF